MRILGFYHICQINHWEEIVSEQIKLLLSSGLYEASENIFIGVLGEQQELLRLREILKPYPKFVVAYHSKNIEEYEFATMKILKAKADKETFYGYYLHTKGVSWYFGRNPNAYRGGSYWRASMNYYTISLWKFNIELLDMGYDTVGSQIRTARTPPAYKLHYSGSYCFFKSDYVKHLPKVEAVDTPALRNKIGENIRFEAEMYICSAHPIAATLNQEWIDYNSNKIWQDPK